MITHLAGVQPLYIGKEMSLQDLTDPLAKI